MACLNRAVEYGEIKLLENATGLLCHGFSRNMIFKAHSVIAMHRCAEKHMISTVFSHGWKTRKFENETCDLMGRSSGL